MFSRLIHLFIVATASLFFLSSWSVEMHLPGFGNKNSSGKISFPQNKNEKIQKRCTGFINEFKWEGDSIKIINGTFLGNSGRNFYGDSIGENLDIIWKTSIGKGQTICVGTEVETWMGAGWTGQPLMVEEKGTPFIIQGCYDHNLKKVNATTGEIVWNYPFSDIIKGTGTLYVDKERNDLLVMQGSRIGFKIPSWQKEIFSYRAVSFFTGQEVWRMNVKRGPSYSRDVDASALVLNDTAYIGLENGYFTVFDPKQKNAEIVRDSFHAKIIQEENLFADADKKLHGGELVTESSPSKIGDHLYITSGSGHVYGFNLTKKKIDWDFYIGSDLDGSAIVTNDSCLIITVEKQFIKGRGGAMKIDPRKSPENCVVWYFPTGDKHFSDWKGGIIGSAAVSHPTTKYGFTNENYNKQLCAFMGIDGFLYVVNQNEIAKDELVYGPDSITQFPTPKILFRQNVGASIATPLIVGNRIVSAGYSGLHIFEFDPQYNFRELATFKGFFESTPFAHKGKIYIASRNGFLYCFGKKTENL